MHQTQLTYTSIKSVLPRIYMSVQDPLLTEETILEWASTGYKSFNSHAKYEDTCCMLKVENGRANLPKDLIFINQIVYKTNFTVTPDNIAEIERWLGFENDAFAERILETPWYRSDWAPMRRSTSTFANSMHDLKEGQNFYSDSKYRYTIKYPKLFECNFTDGYIIVSYKRYLTDEDGYFIIPDEPEDVKNALYHWVMYNYWTTRVPKDKQLAISERNFHLMQYGVYKPKSIGYLNMPDIDDLENIKSMTTRLVPRQNFYNSLFSQIGTREWTK